MNNEATILAEAIIEARDGKGRTAYHTSPNGTRWSIVMASDVNLAKLAKTTDNEDIKAAHAFIILETADGEASSIACWDSADLSREWLAYTTDNAPKPPTRGPVGGVDEYAFRQSFETDFLPEACRVLGYRFKATLKAKQEPRRAPALFVLAMGNDVNPKGRTRQEHAEALARHTQRIEAESLLSHDVVDMLDIEPSDCEMVAQLMAHTSQRRD